MTIKLIPEFWRNQEVPENFWKLQEQVKRDLIPEFLFILDCILNSRILPSRAPTNHLPILLDILCLENLNGILFNRPGVAGAVLQTPLLLINSLIKSWFVKISLWHRHAQMVEIGAFNHKINYITIFQEIPNLQGHQNCITASRVTAILLNGWIFLLDKVVKLVGGGSVINGAYPVQFYISLVFLKQIRGK